MKLNNKNICLIVFPLKNSIEECGQYYVLQILSFIAPTVNHVSVITANFYSKFDWNNVEVFNVKIDPILQKRETVISKLSRLIRSQFFISMEVFKQRKKFDIVIFHLGASILILPALVAYLLKKKIVVATTGSGSKSIKYIYRGIFGKIYAGIFGVMEQMVYSLSSSIIVLSESMISELGIKKYKYKILYNVSNSNLGVCNSCIDTDLFHIKQNWNNRGDVIGYIGRLSGEKGIIEFIEAIPLILKERNNAKFLVVGDGPIIGDLKKMLDKSGCLDNVIFTGAIPHDEIPEVLNRMKFLVIPSYTEVVAAVALEGMSCGTICIATPVGATKDIIINGETGFIMENNKPSTIANRLLSVWKTPDLEIIQLKARKFVEYNFTRKVVQEKWTNILNTLFEC